MGQSGVESQDDGSGGTTTNPHAHPAPLCTDHHTAQGGEDRGANTTGAAQARRWQEETATGYRSYRPSSDRDYSRAAPSAAAVNQHAADHGHPEAFLSLLSIPVTADALRGHAHVHWRQCDPITHTHTPAAAAAAGSQEGRSGATTTGHTNTDDATRGGSSNTTHQDPPAAQERPSAPPAAANSHRQPVTRFPGHRAQQQRVNRKGWRHHHARNTAATTRPAGPAAAP
mmetsp:Transcript_31040/g.90188  ORF Transcript_31040/g.90188 Transcript_31040/m.90188 type:complete len:228 (-) Transcript_31040:1161-1844(-)